MYFVNPRNVFSAEGNGIQRDPDTGDHARRAWEPASIAARYHAPISV
jgi:hypothetical protein